MWVRFPERSNNQRMRTRRVSTTLTWTRKEEATKNLIRVETAESITTKIIAVLRQTSRMEVVFFLAGMAAAVFLPLILK